MKGKIMLEVEEVVVRECPPREEVDGFRAKVEEVTFKFVEPSEEEQRQYKASSFSGRVYMYGNFTVHVSDPDLFGTFKVGDKIDLSRALCTPETT